MRSSCTCTVSPSSAHDGNTSHTENVKVMQNALKQFAADSKHPELVNAPYVATGFSAGGGFASRLLVEAPDKVIASVIVGSRLKLTDITPTAAHLGTPACIINGEHEHEWQGGMAAVVEPVLADTAQKGPCLGGWRSPAAATNATDRKCWPCRCWMPRSDSSTPPMATYERGR